jgi:site-specific recombinase XerD
MIASNVRKMASRAREVAELGLPVHPHMLCHALGYRLADDGRDTRALQHYLGHKNIAYTVRYRETAPNRLAKTRTCNQRSLNSRKVNELLICMDQCGVGTVQDPR